MIIKHRQIPRTSAADSILGLIKRLKERLRAFHCDALLCNQRSSSSSAPTFQGCGALAGRSIREWLHGAILLAAAPLRINRLTLTRSKLSNAWSRGGGSQGLVTRHTGARIRISVVFLLLFSLCRGPTVRCFDGQSRQTVLPALFWFVLREIRASNWP